MTARHTHQTTLRFSKELWRQLERAADVRGVSVAQYVRDAARAQLASEPQHLRAPSEVGAALRDGADEARQRSLGEAESAAALWEQGRLARERAQMLRDQARERRALHWR